MPVYWFRPPRRVYVTSRMNGGRPASAHPRRPTRPPRLPLDARHPRKVSILLPDPSKSPCEFHLISYVRRIAGTVLSRLETRAPFTRFALARSASRIAYPGPRRSAPSSRAQQPPPACLDQITISTRSSSDGASTLLIQPHPHPHLTTYLNRPHSDAHQVIVTGTFDQASSPVP